MKFVFYSFCAILIITIGSCAIIKSGLTDEEIEYFKTYGYPTRDSVHIFWQPDVIITQNDYISLEPSTKEVEDQMEEFDFSASASVGLWSVLDIPRKKSDRYCKMEKVYFAPAFERTTSYIETNDSLQIAIANTFFDICEIWARMARQKLYNPPLDSIKVTVQDSLKHTGWLPMMFLTVRQEMEENRIAMSQEYFNDVIIEKKDGAFLQWRELIETWLEETKEYSTSPKECYRLMIDRPIERDYIFAPKLIGPLLQ